MEPRQGDQPSQAERDAELDQLRHELAQLRQERDAAIAEADAWKRAWAEVKDAMRRRREAQQRKRQASEQERLVSNEPVLEQAQPDEACPPTPASRSSDNQRPWFDAQADAKLFQEAQQSQPSQRSQPAPIYEQLQAEAEDSAERPEQQEESAAAGKDAPAKSVASGSKGAAQHRAGKTVGHVKAFAKSATAKRKAERESPEKRAFPKLRPVVVGQQLLNIHDPSICAGDDHHVSKPLHAETVRDRDERRRMLGIDCPSCSKFYWEKRQELMQAYPNDTAKVDKEMKAYIGLASRHRTHHPPALEPCAEDATRIIGFPGDTQWLMGPNYN